MLQRPDNFRFNYHAPHAQGLVFAGLGFRGSDKTTHYRDSSLYGNHGMLANMDPATDWVWSNDLGRWLCTFDAADQYIDLGTSGMPTAAPLTLAAWGMSTSVSATTYLMSLGQNSSTGDFFAIRFAGSIGGDPIQAAIDGGVPAGQSDGMQYSANILYHVCGVFASNVLRTCYVNGIPGTPDTTDATPSNISLASVGALRRSIVVGPHSGLLGDCCVWNRILSPSEISQLADPSNVMLSGLILPPTRKSFAAAVAAPIGSYPVLPHHGMMM